jgi:hypothetical protein
MDVRQPARRSAARGDAVDVRHAGDVAAEEDRRAVGGEARRRVRCARQRLRQVGDARSGTVVQHDVDVAFPPFGDRDPRAVAVHGRLAELCVVVGRDERADGARRQIELDEPVAPGAVLDGDDAPAVR